MSFRTVQSQQGCGTASTALHWDSANSNRMEKQEKPQPPTTRLGQPVFRARGALAFGDFAGLDAAGADAHPLAGPVDLGLNGLQVHVTATPGGVVGLRYVCASSSTL